IGAQGTTRRVNLQRRQGFLLNEGVRVEGKVSPRQVDRTARELGFTVAPQIDATPVSPIETDLAAKERTNDTAGSDLLLGCQRLSVLPFIVAMLRTGLLRRRRFDAHHRDHIVLL